MPTFFGRLPFFLVYPHFFKVLRICLHIRQFINTCCQTRTLCKALGLPQEGESPE